MGVRSARRGVTTRELNAHADAIVRLRDHTPDVYETAADEDLVVGFVFDRYSAMYAASGHGVSKARLHKAFERARKTAKGAIPTYALTGSIALENVSVAFERVADSAGPLETSTSAGQQIRLSTDEGTQI